MAIDVEAVRFLLTAARSGAAFQDTVMLGRQEYYVEPPETRRLLKAHGLDPTKYEQALLRYPDPRGAEAFFTTLGAERIQSMDASPYEGATLVHDLNEPVPASLAGRFDAVYDGGTIEHVFNVSAALGNCMRMAKVGGRVFLHTPANNYFGHGFYQFSPELFFRVFCPANGFVIERLVAIEYNLRRRWYEVSDPRLISARTVLINFFPVLLFVQALKTTEVAVFAINPQQSDYADTWNQNEKAKLSDDAPGIPAAKNPPSWMRSSMRRLVGHLPGLVRLVELRRFCGLRRAFSFRNRRAFTPLSKRRLEQ